MDRKSYSRIVKDASKMKREKYIQIFNGIELFDMMTKEEKYKLADSLRKKKYRKGQFLVKQGEKSKSFFIVETGQAKVEEIEEITGDVLENVFFYKKGENFGSFGLLKDIPRAASVIGHVN